jgi:orotate phosphoribosyltransferase-like protein
VKTATSINQYYQNCKRMKMSKFKNLVIDIMEMHERGRTVAEIATALQLGRSVVEYVIDTYAAELAD